MFPTNGTFGDESRYITYATYILNGFQSTDTTGFDYLGNGPGYPLFLIPFVALDLPVICITLVNALLYYCSIILVFKTVSRVASFRIALLAGLFWACHINQIEFVSVIYTETFTTFLATLLMYYLMTAFSKSGLTRHLIFSGLIIGYMALTKSIFGYVLICMLVGCLVLYLVNSRVRNYRKSVIVLLVAFSLTVPYLFYTWTLTGKTFYWSTFGGNNLYWMSTPYKGEYGDWFRDPAITSSVSTSDKPGYEELIMKNHGEDFEEFNKYEGAAKDDAFKKAAINNIRTHPFKYIQNCFANIGRILFNYPYSYTLQKPTTLLRLPFNGIILVLLLFCIIPTVQNWRRINFPIRFLLFFALIYLGGSIFGSAETRMFTIAVPILLLYIGFVFQKAVRINLESWNKMDRF